MNKIFINTDGGSRGNPGPAGIGVVFYDQDEKEIYTHKECIGTATNNEAEYGAIISALKILLKDDLLDKESDKNGEVICRLDSQLVVEQINGRYKIKQPHLQVFNDEIKGLLNELQSKISFIHVRREQNKRADQLVNEALDAELKAK